MRYKRSAVYWSLVLVLGAAFHAGAAIRPDSAASNAPPPDSTPATHDATAAESSSASSTPIVTSFPMPTPLEAGAEQPQTGFPWKPLVVGVLGILICMVGFLKFSSWYKQRYLGK